MYRAAARRVYRCHGRDRDEAQQPPPRCWLPHLATATGVGWLRSFRCSTPPARAPGCPRREACVVLFGVDAAAISLVFDGTNVGTLGASGVSARVYDELQFTLGEGPCLDSVAHRAPVVVVDLADPDVVRWPAYGPAMLASDSRRVRDAGGGGRPVCGRLGPVS